MKFLLKLFTFLALLIVILFCSLVFWLKTDKGIRTITNFVSSYIEKTTDNNYQIRIDRLKFSFPLVIEAKKIILSEKEEHIVTIEDFYINITPSIFWLWKIEIKEIAAQKIILAKIPDSFNDSSTNDSSELNMNFIPTINIPKINIPNLSISSTLTGFMKDFSMIIEGNLAFNSSDKTIVIATNLKTNLDSDKFSDENLLLLNNGALEIKAEINCINQNVNIESFKFSSIHSTIDGNITANIQEDFINGKIIYNSKILELLMPTSQEVTSDLSGEINLSGSLALPHIITDNHISFSSNDSNYFRLPDLQLHSDFFIGKDEIKGQLSLNGETLNAVGEINIKDQKYYLKNFAVKGKNSFVSNTDLIFDNTTKILTGEFIANSNNINELNDFFPFLQKGNLDIKTTFKSNESGQQQVTVLGNIKNLVTSHVNCDLINLNLVIKDLWNYQIDYADIKVRSLLFDQNSIRNFTISAKGHNEYTDITTHVEGLRPYPLNLTFNSTIINNSLKNRPIKENSFNIIQNIQGSIGNTNFNTPEPIKIIIGQILSISAPNIKANDGKLNLSITKKENEIKGKILMNNFPLDLIPHFLPTAFDKAISSGNLEINSNSGSLNLNSELTINNILMGNKNKNFAVLKLSSKILNDQLSINSNILYENKSLGSLKALLPCKLSLSPVSVIFSQQENIDITLSLQQAQNILTLIPLPPAHKLLGNVGGTITAKGNLASPIIKGSIIFTGVEYKYKPHGINLKNISGKLIAQNKNILIENFIAKDIHSNILEGKGKLSLTNNFSYDFDLKTKKFNFISTPYLQGEAAGEISFAGDSQKALAKGNLNLGPMEIKIPEHFSYNIPTINIVEIKKEEEVLPNSQNKPYIVELDVNLSTAHQVYVRGWGVDTLLSGNLKIINNITNPNIFGKLVSVNGKYQEFNKNFAVKEGTLNFTGPLDPSPYLNIVGVTVINGIEIKLILSGSMFNPDLRIETNPSIPQENALSLILFGKGPENISGVQAFLLANNVRRLSGKGPRSNFDPLGIGKKLLHVDDISIKNNEDSSGTSVGVGKYLTEKVYLEIEQGGQASGTKTKIAVELTPHIAFEAINGDRGDNSIGVNWLYDY